MYSSPTPKNTDKICPHLGLPSDPQTAMDYPSSQNYCHHAKPPVAPGAPHQRRFCLEASYVQCKLYAAKSAKPMPAAFLTEPIITRKQPSVLRWVLLALILLVVIAVAVWLALIWALPAAPARTPTVLQSDLTAPATAAAAQASATLTQTPRPSPTVEPSSTPTPTPQPPHLLETPLGTERQFLLHRVLNGESLISMAGIYYTSVDAIRAVNYSLPGMLWANSVLIIPFNQMDVTGVAPMTAYAISADGITVQALALEQGVSLDALCALNDLPSNYLFHSGEWVILPHTPPTP